MVMKAKEMPPTLLPLNSGKINAKVKWHTMSKMLPKTSIEAALPLWST